MISSLLILNQKGYILINRTYKNDVMRSDIVAFVKQIVYARETNECPVQLVNGCSFLHVTVDDLIFVATSKTNSNAMMILSFLYTFVNVMKSYLGNKITEELIRKNFVLLYELLDEVLDNGFPQVTNLDVLRKYITQGGAKTSDLQDEENLKKLTVQATGNTSWRAEGIKYHINILALNVSESINALVSASGQVLRADVNGIVNVKSRLSGMPECRLQMNDRLSMTSQNERTASVGGGVSLDDINFHQCVRASNFETQRTVTFVPPDGSFDLMTYRVSENIDLPLRVIPAIVERNKSMLEVSLRVKALFESNFSCKNITIRIPVPNNSLKLNVLSVTNGKCILDAQRREIVWKARKLNGECEMSLSVEVSQAPSITEQKWVRPPIAFDFQIQGLLVSGMKIRSLKVQEKSNYTAITQTNFKSQAGSYHHRI
eukprot:GDKJ01003197.1.p1 GENE.GDKJ01003197.1~~GDKJ01003197.1.p1  ORF type:complete len:431 (-),score=85.73 GDKJ01003197.1:423-1715(-)